MKTHSFPPMKQAQRKVVHELGSFYGLETTSYDKDPFRNVIARAIRCV